MLNRCPTCNSRMLIKQVCHEYWTYSFDENGDIGLDALEETHVVSTLKFACSNCGKLDTKVQPTEQL